MNKQAQRLIQQARNKKPSERTRADRTLLMLARGRWVSSLELTLKAGGLGCRARLSDLRKQGVGIEMRLDPRRPKGEQWYQFRLAKDKPVRK